MRACICALFSPEILQAEVVKGLTRCRNGLARVVTDTRATHTSLVRDVRETFPDAKWQHPQTCFPDFQLSDNRATHTSLVRDVSKLDILMEKRQHSQPCFPDFQMSMFDKLDHVSIQELA